MAIGAQIKDPAFILAALRDMETTGAEFPIKVEGTKTLPYAAVVISLDAANGQIIVKLVRPLPPALKSGALFEMVFATQDKRFECRIIFLGREGYLQYRFQGPPFLTATDRRLWKRYPIRPRENLHVAAQDADMPGHGITGPLLNLSMGGLVFRVDRMLRLDDGMLIRPASYMFERGKSLPLMRLRGLPKGEVLEARGQVVRAQESGSELHVAIQFTGMGEPGKLLLIRFLAARERQSIQIPQGGGHEIGPAEGSRLARPSGAPAKPTAEPDAIPEDVSQEEGEAGPGAPLPGPEQAALEAQLLLDRRSTHLLLVALPGEDRDRVALRLEASGYSRLEFASNLFEAHARCKDTAVAPIRLLLVDLEPSRAEGLEPMGAVRHLEPLLRSFGELPVAFVTRIPDPMLELMGRPGFGALALEEEGEGTDWGKILDGLVHGISPA